MIIINKEILHSIKKLSIFNPISKNLLKIKLNLLKLILNLNLENIKKNISNKFMISNQNSINLNIPFKLLMIKSIKLTPILLKRFKILLEIIPLKTFLSKDHSKKQRIKIMVHLMIFLINQNLLNPILNTVKKIFSIWKLKLKSLHNLFLDLLNQIKFRFLKKNSKKVLMDKNMQIFFKLKGQYFKDIKHKIKVLRNKNLGQKNQ